MQKRNFNSSAIEATIQRMKTRIKDSELAWLFENCFLNTLDTTVIFKMNNERPDTFVITGDIHAMWLRDSTAQVTPYLSLIKEDEKLKQLIAGVINRQTECILIDPYANAFNDGAGKSEWLSDYTDMKPELHERKWELGSLCYTVRSTAVFAMNHGKHTAIEVPAATTTDECWQLVEISEKTKKDCMMLENCCYDFFEQMTLNMVRNGILGELVHAAVQFKEIGEKL